MKNGTSKIPGNALELNKCLMETFTALRNGEITNEDAKAQAVIVKESINLMKLDLLVSKFLDVQTIYSPIRSFFGYNKKQISDKTNKDK